MEKRIIKQEINLATLQPMVEDNLLNDGHLCPMLFICNREGATVSDVTKYLEDDAAKDALVDWLITTVQEEHAHKIILIAECWMYAPPEEMSKEDVVALMQMGRHRDFEKVESYQILSFTRESVNAVIRKFTREDDKIILGEVMDVEELTLDRFEPVQHYLEQIN
jgi:hypothetical protein